MELRNHIFYPKGMKEPDTRFDLFDADSDELVETLWDCYRNWRDGNLDKGRKLSETTKIILESGDRDRYLRWILLSMLAKDISSYLRCGFREVISDMLFADLNDATLPDNVDEIDDAMVKVIGQYNYFKLTM